MFGGSKSPTPQPVPINPVDDTVAKQAREDAARAAIADSKMRGRQSTIAAGGDQASTDQMYRGLLKSQKRTGAASTNILGA